MDGSGKMDKQWTVIVIAHVSRLVPSCLHISWPSTVSHSVIVQLLAAARPICFFHVFRHSNLRAKSDPPQPLTPRSAVEADRPVLQLQVYSLPGLPAPQLLYLGVVHAKGADDACAQARLEPPSLPKLPLSNRAKAYLLDPLTAPEPSQEDGPGSSFINPDPLLRTFSQKKKGKEPVRSTKSHSSHGQSSSYPTPPTSASPTRSSFHSSNPFSPTYKPAYLPSPREPASPASPSTSNRAPGRSPSVRSNGFRGPASPSSRFAPSTSVTRSYSAHNRSISEENGGPRAHSSVQRSKSVNHHNGQGGLQRSGSLSQRYPGDMSHRPLDVLKREQRAADRAPHLRTRKNGPVTDTIDSLDTIGGVYHHGGPYDATLASRNRNKMYAPVEAVKESNMEALRATPREYIQDSLEKHVPLQGTGTIPAGARDMRGNVMDYEEGADLMREPDAKGGAYKRWEGIPYHPDDLKGKGEPSYTYEKDLKEKKRMRKASLSNGPADYEMRSGINGQQRKDNGAMVRQRSLSNAADGRPGPSAPPAGQSNSADVRRHNSTGKRLSEGLKRRFGSIRRKNHSDA